MSISEKELYSILYQHFPQAQIKIIDTAGDEDHYSLDIKDQSFKDLTLINQHRMVKNALKGVLSSKLHAITIKTSF